MLTFLTAVAILILGFFTYGKIVDRIMAPPQEPTPAVAMKDDVDYVPMPTWKNYVIEVLNIAGTGPIFGALMGALWGPVVFFWIVGGTILGGGIHDYMSGMMSARNNGESFTSYAPKYLGKHSGHIILILCVFLLIMVTAVFTKSSVDILVYLTDWPVWSWFAIIIAYFAISSFVPIDKIIGKIYPIFGIIIILMALVIIGGLLFNGYTLPGISVENMHPDGLPMWPFMFVTVACGAISGFHATQSPIVARCMKTEKKGRHIFYGAMVTEGIIALIWAAAGIAFAHGDTSVLGQMIHDDSVAMTVYHISVAAAGTFGAIISVLGVVICPITSGDTALRSCRMMIGEHFHINQKNVKNRLMILSIVVAIVVLLCCIDFTIIWRYFSWLNQTLAATVLWTATIYLYKRGRAWWHPYITGLPALFMTAVVSMYILVADEGLKIPYNIGLVISIAITIILTIIFQIRMRNLRKSVGMTSDYM